MPMYEYKCSSCSHLFEKYADGRAAGQAEVEVCPQCGKEGAKRVFSTFSACSGMGRGSLLSGAPSGSGGCGSGGFS